MGILTASAPAWISIGRYKQPYLCGRRSRASAAESIASSSFTEITPMTITLPFLTSYDPPGTSEGALDPLGLYQIADQLAMQLVPAVRERMQRIRFLTAMAVGTLVTEGLQNDPRHRDASPHLVWEWLVVESLIREKDDDPDLWGVAGTLVTRRALAQHGYLDARSYLKTPRIFGIHGVYKRLAVHLGLADIHLAPGPNTERLADAWAQDHGYSSLAAAKPLIDRWRNALRRSLAERPPRTKPGLNSDGWAELAEAFAPWTCKARERQCLRSFLLDADERPLGALPSLWRLQAEFDEESFREETLHDRLKASEPSYGPLLDAIRAYEKFARSLQDAFDVLKAEAASRDAQGFLIPTIANNASFRQSVQALRVQFTETFYALGHLAASSISLQNLFEQRFRLFAEPMDAASCALALCTHHESIQRAKSADGKRPWFDRIGPDRIFIRHAYREPAREILPGRYMHDYRGRPIRRFYRDLS